MRSISKNIDKLGEFPTSLDGNFIHIASWCDETVNEKFYVRLGRLLFITLDQEKPKKAEKFVFIFAKT